MGPESQISRNDAEQLVGRLLLSFNDVEVALIDLIGSVIGNSQFGDVIGWSIGFEQKCRLAVGLVTCARPDDLEARNEIVKLIKDAMEVERQRNAFAHAEYWENPFDDSIGIRKPRVSIKTGFNPRHLPSDKAEIAGCIDKLNEIRRRIKLVCAKFEFDVIKDDDIKQTNR